MIFTKRLKPVVGKWQIVFSYHRSLEFYDPFVRELIIGVVNLPEKPEDGQLIDSVKKKGFYRVYNLKLFIARRR